MSSGDHTDPEKARELQEIMDRVQDAQTERDDSGQFTADESIKDEIRTALEQLELPTIQSKIVEEVSASGSATRNHLQDLVDQGYVTERQLGKNTVLYSLSQQDNEGNQPQNNIFGETPILSTEAYDYLLDGTLNGKTENAILSDLFDQLHQCFTRIPFNDGPHWAEMELLAARFGMSPGELEQLTPSFVIMAVEMIQTEWSTPDVVLSKGVASGSSCREMRKELDLTQQEIADQYDISTRTISHVEREKHASTDDKKQYNDILKEIHSKRQTGGIQPHWIDDVRPKAIERLRELQSVSEKVENWPFTAFRQVSEMHGLRTYEDVEESLSSDRT
jgi:transcriptional regulator with XRE-family HTH domain/DNA-binding transcriptional ArsR family regulator